MNKKELTRAVSKKTRIKQREVDRVIKAMIETMTETLGREEKVQLVGFGTLETRRRKARRGKDPRTGEDIHIDAVTAVTFRTGKTLKECVNQQA